jgi:hypothetical protein
MILRLIETISENLPRFDIYERLQSDHVLQIALLNIFTDVVEFSVLALKYFGRGTFGELFVWQLLVGTDYWTI